MYEQALNIKTHSHRGLFVVKFDRLDQAWNGVTKKSLSFDK